MSDYKTLQSELRVALQRIGHLELEQPLCDAVLARALELSGDALAKDHSLSSLATFDRERSLMMQSIFDSLSSHVAHMTMEQLQPLLDQLSFATHFKQIQMKGANPVAEHRTRMRSLVTPVEEKWRPLAAESTPVKTASKHAISRQLTEAAKQIMIAHVTQQLTASHPSVMRVVQFLREQPLAQQVQAQATQMIADKIREAAQGHPLTKAIANATGV